MTENKFANGLIFKLPRNNAPDFVKGSLAIKKEDFIKRSVKPTHRFSVQP